jgi:L-lactate dehydrogenase complex protein LldG
MSARGIETGDRAHALAVLRARLAGGVPHNPAHPVPGPLASIPVAHSSMLDPADLVGSFIRNARDVRVVVHEVEGDEVPFELVADLVRRHRVERAVVSAQPDADTVGRLLTRAGVEVAPISKQNSAEAELGVTAASAAIATTGTLVQHSGDVGGRTASLLPPTHLCVLRASRIVANSADVLRGLGQALLPSNVVLVTGPSRSGDIEQIIALGVHGPVAVEVALLLQG